MGTRSPKEAIPHGRNLLANLRDCPVPGVRLCGAGVNRVSERRAPHSLVPKRVSRSKAAGLNPLPSPVPPYHCKQPSRRIVRMTNRYFAILGLIAAAIAVSPARAAVVNGAAAKVPVYQARGATEIAVVGPLAPSLQGKPVVVRIHADWCPACKATQSTIDDLKQAYAGKINFVQFDLTNANTAATSQAEAQKLGLGKFYDASKAATSTVVLTAANK